MYAAGRERFGRRRDRAPCRRAAGLRGHPDKGLAALGRELSEDFVHSSPGQPDQPREAFLAAIRDMPYAVRGIEGQDLRVRELGEAALLSGIQRARVALPDGREVVARTAFVDIFTRQDGRWRLRHAWSVELPEDEAP